MVDLSPSLCDVARKRFKRLGWQNVSVVCQDARTFRLSGDGQNAGGADLITMSYSLSMIPGELLISLSFITFASQTVVDYYSVVDSLASLLKDSGIIGACDFYGRSYYWLRPPQL